MDPFVVIVVVGAVSLIKWLIENAGKFQGNESQGAPPPAETRRQTPIPQPRYENEEEKMRRFMEALGLPTESAPPAPVNKPAPPAPATPPPLRPAARPLAPASRMNRPAVRPVAAPVRKEVRPVHTPIAPPLDTGGPLPTLPKTASVDEAGPSMEVANLPQMTFVQPEQAVAAAATEVSAAMKAAPTPAAAQQPCPAPPQAALRDLLRTPGSLRAAVLLREILGPPKGLQSAQHSSIFTSS